MARAGRTARARDDRKGRRALRLPCVLVVVLVPLARDLVLAHQRHACGAHRARATAAATTAAAVTQSPPTAVAAEREHEAAVEPELPHRRGGGLGPAHRLPRIRPAGAQLACE